MSGQAAYREYLQSIDWMEKRAAKLRQAGPTPYCQICGLSQGALDVHHLNYRNWHDVELSDLVILCRVCHQTVHRLLKVEKLTERNGFRTTFRAVREDRGLPKLRHPKALRPDYQTSSDHSDDWYFRNVKGGKPGEKPAFEMSNREAKRQRREQKRRRGM